MRRRKGTFFYSAVLVAPTCWIGFATCFRSSWETEAMKSIWVLTSTGGLCIQHSPERRLLLNKAKINVGTRQKLLEDTFLGLIELHVTRFV